MTHLGIGFKQPNGSFVLHFHRAFLPKVGRYAWRSVRSSCVAFRSRISESSCDPLSNSASSEAPRLAVCRSREGRTEKVTSNSRCPLARFIRTGYPQDREIGTFPKKKKGTPLPAFWMRLRVESKLRLLRFNCNLVHHCVEITILKVSQSLSQSVVDGLLPDSRCFKSVMKHDEFTRNKTCRTKLTKIQPLLFTEQ